MNNSLGFYPIARGKSTTRLLAAGGGLGTHRAVARSAFTFIEMVVSLSIISIVFLAMGSVMVLASKAIPDPKAPTNLTLDAADILQQMVSELQTAKTVILASPTSIRFTVPDRNNDGADETIWYVWSGIAGDPLVRQYNGGVAVNVLPSVSEFGLVYDLKSIPQPDILVKSPEVLLGSHDPAVSVKDVKIKNNTWIAQRILPPGLPADAVSWGVTRVMILAKTSGGLSGESLVQLRPETVGGGPQNTVLEEYPMHEVNLADAYTWQTFTYSSVAGIAPAKGLFLVIKWVADTDAAKVQYDNSSGSGYITSIDRGASWSLMGTTSVVYYAYGTYITPVPQPPINLLRSVTLTLNPGATPSSRVRTAVTELNQPQMP